MRILIYNWKDIKNPEAGGAEVVVFHLARRLVRDGHRVTVFSRTYRGCTPEEIIDGIRVIRRGSRLSIYLHAFFYYRSLGEKPDLVLDMVNTLCWFTPFYVPRAKRLLYVNQLAKEVLFYELPAPLSWVAYGLERLQFLPYRNTDTICFSESTKADLATVGIPGGRTRIFPLGIDHARYASGEKKSEFPLFVFVARLVKMKRADLCIRAMARVRSRHPDARLVLVGRGPDEGRLQRLIADLDLQQHVSLLHRDSNLLSDTANQEQKVRLMQRAWALLLPSVKEGWGMVVTEAAACGTPAIVSDVTGLRDAVVPDRTGLLIPPNPSAAELAAAMLRIIEDTSLRQRLSEGALDWSKNFDWEKSTQSFKTILEAHVRRFESPRSP
ncbi:MAG: glycosyltransferase family 4 protein [bacterium]|nr:glycosyltransferase family 4 protein [bacterium]